MSKIKVRVFPDYMSSGLWAWNKDHSDGRGGGSIDESYVENVVPPALMIALKYWHWIWEKDEERWSSFHFRMDKLMSQFDIDGQLLVDAMNLCQDDFEFIYQKSF